MTARACLRSYRNLIHTALVALLLSSCITGAPSKVNNPAVTVTEVIQSKIQQLKRYRSLEYRGEPLSFVKMIPSFYEAVSYTAIWDRQNRKDMLYAIRKIDEEGLNPRDYHMELIADLANEIERGQNVSSEKLALIDIFLTDSLLRLGYHLLYGKVHPERLDPNWNFTNHSSGRLRKADIYKALHSHDISKYIDDLRPRHYYYPRMKEALSVYRKIKANGGWNLVPPGPLLKPGMTDSRVAQIRNRLLITGDINSYKPVDQNYFDDKLKIGLKKFQKRHGLHADGIVGDSTSEALNVSVQQRIDQLRVNLERARWVLHNLPAEYLVVNIAGFRAFLVKNGRPLWTSKVVVGKTFRQTPVFRADLKYIVFNPTWTVPPVILKNDFLPATKDDSQFLRNQNIRVLNQAGEIISQDTIDWAKYTPENFPYLLRQDPGPENALGQVKFLFPNKHSVYLHDTPNKSLFQKETRTFSSGCIRIQNPLELAELLLRNQDNWNIEEISKVVRSGVITNVGMKKYIPVLILYWTAGVDDEGMIEFMPDVYERDSRVLKELDS